MELWEVRPRSLCDSADGGDHHQPWAIQIGIAGRPAKSRPDMSHLGRLVRSSRCQGNMNEDPDETLAGSAQHSGTSSKLTSPSSRTPALSHRLSSASSPRCGTEPMACATSNALPDASDLEDLEEDNESMSEAKTTKYFKRSSCFTIYLRPVGLREDGRPHTPGVSWDAPSCQRLTARRSVQLHPSEDTT